MHPEVQSNEFEISVIIPVYNDPEGIEVCLNALKKQTLPQDRFEVIVVNNGAADSMQKKEEWNSNVILSHEPLPGSYAARNRGASVARGMILAFIDADCIPDPGWLQYALECFSDTGCDMIGGNIEIFKTNRGSSLAYIYEKNHLFKQKSNTEKGVSVTANFFIKRSAFEEAGGFDPEIKSMGDMEFTGRCTEKGFKMAYSESAMVRHPARKSVRDVLNRRRRIVCWKTIHAGLAAKGKKIRLIRLTLIVSFFGGRDFLRKKAKSGNFNDHFRLKMMIALVTMYEFTVRLSIAANFLDPYKVRQ